MANTLVVGQIAPDFTLPSHDGGDITLSDYRGRKAVVLYFYPSDNTLGCTAQACAFRDAYEVFTDAGAEVIGVSGNGLGSHEAFSDRHRLPFVLLSDKSKAVHDLYGVERKLGLFASRITYVIDIEGVVQMMFDSNVMATRHVTKALAVVQSLTRTAA